MDPQIFGSPETSEKELDDEHELSIEILPDTDEEEKGEGEEMIDEPGWMKDMDARLEAVRQKKIGQEDDSDSNEIIK